MFAVLSRSAQRRAFATSARCLAKKNTTNPSQPPKKQIKTGDNGSVTGSGGKPAAVMGEATGASGVSGTKPPAADSIPEQPPIDISSPSSEPSSTPGLPSLDFSPPDLASEQQKKEERTGARSSKGSLSSTEKRRRFMGQITLAVLALAFATNVVYMGREWEEEELKAKRLKIEDAPSGWWGRTKERFSDLFDYFNKPAWPELLPPPYPPHIQKPYTLLISLDDLIVTSTWDRQNGWRTAKRPGVDYFLAYISQFYEVVIFTTQQFYTAAPILDKLDRYNFYISHRLFREATRSINGKIVKDLSFLNRDLSKVILIDTVPEHVSTHPENAIILPKWTGDPKDKGLVAMIPFLESIAIYKPADVRPILQAYAGKDIPLEYAKKEAEAKIKHIEEWQAKHKRAAGGPSAFGSLFGIGESSHQPKNMPPPTYLEQKRREAQLQYQDEQKYIRDHKEELEKMLDQEQQAMAGQVPGSMWEAFDQFTGKKKEVDGQGSSLAPGTTAPLPEQSQSTSVAKS